MKALRLITTILITLSILLTGYVSFRFYSSSVNPIATGVNLMFLSCMVLILLSFRISLSKGELKPTLPLLITALLILLLLMMYFQREWIEILWNYFIAAFIVLQGINILPKKIGGNRLLASIHITVLLCIFYLASLCIVKAETPLLYVIATIALTAASIGSLFVRVAKK